MKCPHCAGEMQIKQEHCPHCGKHVLVEYDVLARSVLDDAAVRKGAKLESALRGLVLVVIIGCTIIYSINDLFDKPLSYNGAALPALPFKETVSAELTQADEGYVDPRPEPPVVPAPLQLFGHRRDPLREKLEFANGLSKDDALRVRKAIQDGLKFLGSQQRSEGYWEVSLKPRKFGERDQTHDFQWGTAGTTALVMLAYLGEGHSWLVDERGQKGPYATQLERAIRWLLSVQDKSGRFGPSDAPQMMYNHGLATLAMCEAAGLSGDSYLRAAAQSGIDFILAAQNEKGGWRYKQERSAEADISSTAWQVQALWCAREINLNVPEEAFAKALSFYQAATIRDGDGGLRVRYGFGTRDDAGLDFNREKIANRSYAAMGLMIRQLLGETRKVPELGRLGLRLLQNVPSVKPEWGRGWEPDRRNDDTERRAYDPYYVYFATYAMLFLGGKEWEGWHHPARKALLAMQDHDGGWRTSDHFSMCGGFNYSTALSILTLQAYFRLQ